MKKIKSALFISLVAALLTSCGLFEPTKINKTKLEHNVKEYMHNNFYNFSSSPYEGDIKSLIIPIWFKDSTDCIDFDKRDNVLEDIDKSFNAKDQEIGWYSLSSFYEQESFGKLHLNCIISDWLELDASYYDYGDSKGQYNTYYLVSDAVDWYFSTTGENRKSFDADEDGYIDSVVLIYAAPDYISASSNLSNLWAYTSWLETTGKVNNPVPNVYMWASYDFMYSAEYALERTGFPYHGRGASYTQLDAHTFIHEFGHILGLEDYYDYSDHSYKPAGCFSMQDYNIGGHDPFSTLCFEWSEVYKPTNSMTITIKDFQSSHDMILLANHDVTSVFDEYFLLELYTPTILNKGDVEHSYGGRYANGPSAPGIRLWHVDARLLYLENPYSLNPNNITTDPTKRSYGVYLMMSNSYDNSHGSFLGGNYLNYNLLQCIRNDRSESYKPGSAISNNSLFRNGSSFNISTFKSQFVKGSRLNDGGPFLWSFEVVSVSNEEATIKLTLNKE